MKPNVIINYVANAISTQGLHPEYVDQQLVEINYYYYYDYIRNERA